MNTVINLEAYFGKFADTWSPKIVGELNGQHVKLVKLEGDKCPWHSHAQEDELFLVVDGELQIQQRDGVVTLGPGEFYIVPRAVEHRVVPRPRARILLFEPAAIAHTGDVHAEITKTQCDRLIE
jgi:mannose-6-phosphate isomerase-like protein (cupin superfamily)